MWLRTDVLPPLLEYKSNTHMVQVGCTRSSYNSTTESTLFDLCPCMHRGFMVVLYSTIWGKHATAPYMDMHFVLLPTIFVHRCQPSRESPGIGGSVPCPARIVLFTCVPDFQGCCSWARIIDNGVQRSSTILELWLESLNHEHNQFHALCCLSSINCLQLCGWGSSAKSYWACAGSN